MPTSNRPWRIPALTSLSVSLLTAVLYALCASRADGGQYFHVWYAPVMYLAWLITPITLLVMLPRVDSTRPAVTNTPARPVVLAAGVQATVAALAMGISLILAVLSYEGALRPEMRLFGLVGGILCLLGAAAPLLTVLDKRFASAAALCHLALTLSMICLAMYLYFDTSFYKNASHKLCLSLAVCLLVLYLVCEAREALECPRPRFAALLGLSCAPLLAGVGVGAAVLSVKVRGSILTSPVTAIFCVLFFLYIYIRTATRTLAPKEEQEGTPCVTETSEEQPNA